MISITTQSGINHEHCIGMRVRPCLNVSKTIVHRELPMLVIY